MKALKKIWGRSKFILLLILFFGCTNIIYSQAFNMDQTLSDGAQRMTISFDALAFFTGSLGADSFFPPGKVADFWGFQYLRDNDPSEMGHNTDFLTKASLNMFSILTTDQKNKLIALAKKQVTSINEYGYARFVLMKAFRRLIEGDTNMALNKEQVKKYSADLYLLDGKISYERAVVMGAILKALTSDQQAYLNNMVGKGMLTWPTVEEPAEMRSIQNNDEKVAVMTYSGDLFSWYAGSVTADVYFCPERQGTYFGSFYLKDAPAVGNPNYTISSSLTADYGNNLIKTLTTAQAKLISDLVTIQKPFLLDIVSKRTDVSTLLRKFIAGQTADSLTVMNLMKLYGEDDGEIVYNIATNFAKVYKTLSSAQISQLKQYRTEVIGTLNPTGAYLFATPISIPQIQNTDFLFVTSTVTLSSNPSTGGITSGAGTFIAGTSVTVTATPNTGYSFSGWTENGVTVSTSQSYTFTLKGDKNLVANFSTGQYTVTLSSNPVNGGTTTGSGSYNSGSTVTLTAAPNSGYTFSNWTENGIIVSTNSTYTFTITASRTLVANFTTFQYSVTASVNPANSGTTTGSGSYSSGSTVTLAATPNNGYTFSNWTESGTVVSTSSSYSFTLSGNKTFVANFSPKQYTVTLSNNPLNGGIVNGGGTFNFGSSVSVSATPNSEFTFSNWTENGAMVSNNATYVFTLGGNRTLTANYIPKQYTIVISCNPNNGGTASGAGAYNSGSSVLVIAIPNPGYNFINWTENGTEVSTRSGYSFTITGNKILVANFSAVKYTITTNSNPTNGGKTSGGGAYNLGSSATITATPEPGYTFSSWTENGVFISASAIYTFTVMGNKTFTANFIPVKYSIKTNMKPENGGVITGAGSYDFGSQVTLDAKPNSGYLFNNWIENGQVVSTEAIYKFTVAGDRNLTANFNLMQFNINAAANLPNSGTINGTGTYTAGSSITLRAIPNKGYVFTNWTENGSVVSTNPNYTFIVNSDRTILSNFSPEKYTVTTGIFPGNGGKADGGGSFFYGNTVTVNAAANNGFKFFNWTEDGIEVSKNAAYSFVIIKTRNLIANYVNTTKVNNPNQLPDGFALEQNYPNPFNPSTVISFQLSDNSFVTLKIYDILGKEVKMLVNEIMAPGYYQVEFDATDLPGGIYFYKLTSAEFTQTRKMILTK